MKKQMVTKSVAKLLGTATVGLSLAGALSACGQSGVSNTSFASSMERPDVQVIDINQISASSASKETAAEEIALIAESLLRPNTYIQANALAREALSLNQFNIRAQFVDKITQPQLELKGLYKRILPIVSTRPEKLAEYTEFLTSTERMVRDPKLGMKDADTQTFYFADGQPQLKSESDFQDVVEKYVERVDEVRSWLKTNRKQALTVNMYKELSDAPICRAKETSLKVWELTGCQTRVEKTSAKMNVADFEMLRQNVAGVQVYIAMLTMYSVDGLFKNADKIPGGKGAVQALNGISGLGKLRNNKFAALLPEVAQDAIVGVRLAAKHHKTLCPKGSPADGSRKGMLFHSGICAQTTSAVERVMGIAEQMIQGKVVTATFITSNEPVEATVDYQSFKQNPPQDLRELGPVGYNGCGDLEILGNGTAGGLFPKGDLNAILREENKNCQQ